MASMGPFMHMPKGLRSGKRKKGFKKLTKILGKTPQVGDSMVEHQLSTERKLEVAEQFRHERKKLRIKTVAAVILIATLMLFAAYEFSSYWIV